MPSRPKSQIKTSRDAFTAIGSALRQSIRQPDIHGYQPHDKQVVFHSSDSHGRQFIGGNRSGKTVGGAAEACFYSRLEHPFKPLPWDEPTRGRVVTVDVTQGIEKIVKPEIQKWMPKSALIDGSWEKSYNKELRTLTLANGSFIEFLTYEQDLEKFAGTSRHWVWFDEEPPEDIYTECMLRLLDTGGHWWMTMTPVEGMTWTFDNIYSKAGIDPNIFVVEVDTDDNPHIGEEEKERVFGALTEDERTARKHGRYISRGGLIYPEFDPSIHVIDPIGPPRGWLRFDCMDHGLTNPTSWLFCAVDKDGRILVFDEHYKSNMIIAQHAQVVLEKDKLYGTPAYRVGDPSVRNSDPITGTSVQIEYIDNGVALALGNNDVVAGIDRVRKYFRGTVVNEEVQIPQIYITRNCVNLIWELRRYVWATWQHKRTERDKNRKEEPRKKDDHACDALRYGVASRPEVDNGTHVPGMRPTLPEGASESIDPDKPFIDKELQFIGNNRYSDYNLGEEF